MISKISSSAKTTSPSNFSNSSWQRVGSPTSRGYLRFHTPSPTASFDVGGRLCGLKARYTAGRDTLKAIRLPYLTAAIRSLLFFSFLFVFFFNCEVAVLGLKLNMGRQVWDRSSETIVRSVAIQYPLFLCRGGCLKHDVILTNLKISFIFFTHYKWMQFKPIT